MYDVQRAVQEAQSCEHARRDGAQLRLGQRAVRCEQLRQAAAVHVLEHNRDAAFRQERGVQRHDGGAAQRGVQAAQLGDDALAHRLAHVERDDFQRKQRVRRHVQRGVHDAGHAAPDDARHAQVAQRNVERALRCVSVGVRVGAVRHSSWSAARENDGTDTGARRSTRSFSSAQRTGAGDSGGSQPSLPSELWRE